MEYVSVKNQVTFSQEILHKNFKRIINQVYKLLPLREQGQNWIKPLETLIVELSGLKNIVENEEQSFLILLSKMKGLLSLSQQENMPLYRRIIFECLGLLSEIDKNVCIRDD